MDEIGEKKEGILAFWTLKNPNFPEKIIKNSHSFTCCQFSKQRHNLIATGDSNGNIQIWDVTRPAGQELVVSSKDIEEKHTDIVWEIRWVDRAEKGETLVSISGDG